VTAGAAGTAIVTVPVLVVSATEVAVTVTVSAELEAAGAVYVAALAVWFDSVPPPLTLHVTPPGVLSFVTVADSVTASVASTVAADAVTATLTGLELPPQPEMLKAAIAVMASRHRNARVPRPEGLQLFRNIDPSQIVKQIASPL
jgi:hypothetical protein